MYQSLLRAGFVFQGKFLFKNKTAPVLLLQPRGVVDRRQSRVLEC